MKRPKRFFFLIRSDNLERQDVHGLLDMLRYDRAVIECNPPGGFYLLSADRYPTVDRWRSFSIYVTNATPKAVESNPFWGSNDEQPYKVR